MRMQAEEGLDQLALFDKKWFETALQKEPRILEILQLISTRFGIPFALIQHLLQQELFSDEWRSARAGIPTVDYV